MRDKSDKYFFLLHLILLQGIQEFIPQFYSASPLGQLGLVVMKDRRAERLVSLGGSPAEINSALLKLIKDGFKCSGQCSLINAINVSKSMLTAVGEHSNKEIIFIVGALSTVDPESPENTIQKGTILNFFLDNKININFEWSRLVSDVQLFHYPQKFTFGASSLKGQAGTILSL